MKDDSHLAYQHELRPREGALRLPRSKRAFHRACLPIGVCQVEAAVQGWFRVEDVGAGHNCARGRVVDT